MSYPTLMADRLINDLGILDKADLLRLEEIAWVRGVLVEDSELDGAEARLVIAKGRGVITITTDIQDQRRRFSIAHELGHFEMHRGIQELSLCLNQDIREINSKTYNNKPKLELEANEFASALLMPNIFFAPLCIKEEPSLSYISELSNTFMTSLTSTALRYVQLCNEPVVIILSKNNKIHWFQGSPDFERLREDLNLFIELDSKLDSNSLETRIFQGSSNPIKKRRTKASNWFTSGDFDKTATVSEHSIAMPNYDAALSLVWVDEELDEDYSDASEE
ncbi:MAG: ImmA/IrrE family metallo-endopeptidase [Chloroflexi bacterium]|nr:ImmA/IrrE family metallo-endopeptidase [Chloroflexota bacterium]